MLTTISDRKIPVYSGSSLNLPGGFTVPIADYFEPDMVSATDYYPFGMVSRGVGPSDKYRFGFNGKENDNEVKGFAQQQDYGMRIYDPRVGRFLSVDPLQKDYPWFTPYQFAGNSPIGNIDLDGLENYNYHLFVTKNSKGEPVLGYAFDGKEEIGLVETFSNLNTSGKPDRYVLSAGNKPVAVFSSYQQMLELTHGKTISEIKEVGQRNQAEAMMTAHLLSEPAGQAPEPVPQGMSPVQQRMLIRDASNEEMHAPTAPLSGAAKPSTGSPVVRQAAAANSGSNIGTLSLSTEGVASTANIPFASKLTFAYENQPYQVNATVPYKRPNNATTPTQRALVNQPGATCITCGTAQGPFNADHKNPIAIEHLTTGTIDKTKMRSVNAVQPQCVNCSNAQGNDVRNAIAPVQRKLKEKQNRQTTNGTN